MWGSLFLSLRKKKGIYFKHVTKGAVGEEIFFLKGTKRSIDIFQLIALAKAHTKSSIFHFSVNANMFSKSELKYKFDRIIPPPQKKELKTKNKHCHCHYTCSVDGLLLLLLYFTLCLCNITVYLRLERSTGVKLLIQPCHSTFSLGASARPLFSLAVSFSLPFSFLCGVRGFSSLPSLFPACACFFCIFLKFHSVILCPF